MKKLNNVICLDKHPLVKHKITLLRDKNTSSKVVRELIDELTTILFIESCNDLNVEDKSVDTPLCRYSGSKMPHTLLIPILRAGLSMLQPALRLVPNSKVGFLGLARNEKTMQPEDYYFNIPALSKDNTAIYILDPMLATGGSITRAIDRVTAFWGDELINKIRLVTILSVADGIKTVHDKYPSVKIYTANIDPLLNELGFIVPGLGDAGDRTFNTTH